MIARPPPRPSDHGLPDDFDLGAYEREQAEATKSANFWGMVAAVGTLAAVVAAIWAYGIEIAGWGNKSLGVMASLVIVWLPLTVQLQKFLSQFYTPSEFKGDPANAVSSFRSAAEEWKESELETGLSFWRAKRGVEFELAIRRMLEKRGCSVGMTKGSGDGGIDLIIRGARDQRLLWCQCKGHAKPVGVASIREIAGVCSRGGASPVFFAVNGYTKAARETAKELGVEIYDAPDLAAIAKNQSFF